MRRHQNGFTLIELMITVVIVAIVATIAAPSFRTMIVNTQSDALGEDLSTAFQVARSEAVKTSGYVTVCSSSDGASCSGGWADGFIVFSDSATSNSAAVSIADSADLLRITEFDNPNASISATGPAFVRYDGRGMMVNSTDPFELTSYVGGCVGKRVRVISINRSGLINMRRNSCL